MSLSSKNTTRRTIVPKPTCLTISLYQLLINFHSKLYCFSFLLFHHICILQCRLFFTHFTTATLGVRRGRSTQVGRNSSKFPLGTDSKTWPRVFWTDSNTLCSARVFSSCNVSTTKSSSTFLHRVEAMRTETISVQRLAMIQTCRECERPLMDLPTSSNDPPTVHLISHWNNWYRVRADETAYAKRPTSIFEHCSNWRELASNSIATIPLAIVVVKWRLPILILQYRPLACFVSRDNQRKFN